jgi:hypothetical protein
MKVKELIEYLGTLPQEAHIACIGDRHQDGYNLLQKGMFYSNVEQITKIFNTNGWTKAALSDEYGYIYTGSASIQEGDQVIILDNSNG